MRKSIRVSLLVMVMAVSAHAGDMQCGAPGTPPSQPATAEQEQEPIQESSVGSDNSNEAADTLTEFALSLLAGVLAAI
jgi:hypothetical protein